MLENRRVLLLTDGHLGVFTSKTATCILRYRPREVVALLDRNDAGRDPADIVGVGRGIRIERRLDIISGPHRMLADDPQFGPLAHAHAVKGSGEATLRRNRMACVARDVV